MNKSQKNTAAAVGGGLAALAAAAAGVYFFAGKQGEKHRKTAAKWAKNAKDDLMKELKSLEKVTKANYNKAVDTVTKQYKGLKDVDPKELQALALELKNHWDSIALEIEAAGNKVAAKATKAVGIKKAPAKKAPAKKPAAKAKAKKK